jgi:hypothetical protein
MVNIRTIVDIIQGVQRYTFRSGIVKTYSTQSELKDRDLPLFRNIQ